MRYTVPDQGMIHPSIGANSVLEDEPTLASQPIVTPTASGVELTSGPDRRSQLIIIIVVGSVVGLGVLVGGLVLFARRRRLKIDAERSSKPPLSLGRGEGLTRIGMLEASIVRARYRRLEPSVMPLGGQTSIIPPMEKATLVGGVARQSSREPRRARPPDLTLSESRSRTRTEASHFTIALPQSSPQRLKKRPLLESKMISKTALPPYPGSPLTRQ
jgi:hypothetical protein